MLTRLVTERDVLQLTRPRLTVEKEDFDRKNVKLLRCESLRLRIMHMHFKPRREHNRRNGHIMTIPIKLGLYQLRKLNFLPDGDKWGTLFKLYIHIPLKLQRYIRK